MASLMERMIGAARLDARLYEEVEADSGATGQATLVVVLSSVAAGIGMGAHGLTGLVSGSLMALVGWLVWAFLTYLIGTRLLPEERTQADLGQLLRTIGFASSPGLVRILGIVPGLGRLVMAVSAVWMLAAMVIAVRQALDYSSTWRAVVVCLLGFIVQIVLGSLLMTMLGAGRSV